MVTVKGRVALGGLLMASLSLAACETEPAPPEPARRTVRLDVDWPDAGELDRDGFVALSERSQAAVLRSEVPVLVPTEAIESALVTARPAWTAVSARRDGLTISLHATRVAHRYPNIKPSMGPDEVRSHPAFITQNEGIWSASWREFGAFYALEVECDAPTDARCADDARVRSMAETLRYLGGKLHADQLEGAEGSR